MGMGWSLVIALLAPVQEEAPPQRVAWGHYLYLVPKGWKRADCKDQLVFVPPDSPGAVLRVFPPAVTKDPHEAWLDAFVRKHHANLCVKKQTPVRTADGDGGTELLTRGFVLESDGATQYRIYVSSRFDDAIQVAVFLAFGEEGCRKYLPEFEAFLHAAQAVAALPEGPARPILEGEWRRTGPDESVADLALNGDTIYAATGSGLVAGDGQVWQTLRRGRFVQVVLAGSRIYALEADGTLHRYDGGWSTCRPPEKRTLHRIGANAGVLYAAVREGVPRLYRSAGDAWRPVAQNAYTVQDGSEFDYADQRIDLITVDPADPELVLATFAGLPMQSCDGGVTFWDVRGRNGAGAPRRMPRLPTAVHAGRSLHIDEAHPHVRYVRIGAEIHRTTDGGGTWTKLAWPREAKAPLSIAGAAGTPRLLYATTAAGLWVTSDAGSTWTRVKASEVEGRENEPLLVHPKTGRVYRAGTKGVEVLTP